MAQSQPSGDYVHQEAALQTLQDASPGARRTTTAAAASDVQPKNSWSQGAAAAGVAAKETFGCQHCSKSFNRRENLSRHLKTHDASPSHVCQKCGKGFTRSDLLRRHEAGHERWDSQGPKDRSGISKRRKVGFEETSSSTSASGSSSANAPSWSPQPQPNPRGRPASSPNQMIGHPQVAYTQHGLPQMGIPHTPLVDRTIRINEYQPSPYQNYQVPMNSIPGSVQDVAYAHPQTANEYMSNFQAMQSMEVPFDFSSFLLPSDTGPIGNEWFSYDFYSAMRETGNDLGSLGDIVDQQMLTPSVDYGSIPDTNSMGSVGGQDQLLEANPIIQEEPRGRSEEPPLPRDIRDTSPPNEASEEDKWPFQWNPLSRPVLRAHALSISSDHPFVQNHDPRFDISETTLLRLKAFLNPSGRDFNVAQRGSFVLPSLPIINILIRLFFKHFSPQMPVLHHATVNTNTDLPPPLLGAMVVIGAIYSHLKHTRRFAIVLLDIVRWNLQVALECDNSLMRDSMIIYSYALITHTGLWCGNKRAFELAEVVRGALVTYIRRVKFGEPLPQYPSTRPKSKPSPSPNPSNQQSNQASPSLSTASSSSTPNQTTNLTSDWRTWIGEESLRRLSWVIYSIDAQFPTLINMTSSISIGEISSLGCPCDEEFWTASSPRQWKNLLGPATIPPSRSFSAAVGPFILPSSSSTQNTTNQSQNQHHQPLNLNPWSAFLVLTALQTSLFEYSQTYLLVRHFDDDPSILHSQSLQKSHLTSSLQNWISSYQNLSSSFIPQTSNSNSNPSNGGSATNKYFHSSSLVIHHLSVVLLEISLSDLQASIGKDGREGTELAFVNLNIWAREEGGEKAVRCVINAARTIQGLDPGRGGEGGFEGAGGLWNLDTAPYSLIAVFLCHIVLWVFANVGSGEQRVGVVEELERGGAGVGFLAVLRRGFGLDGEGGRGGGGEKEREKDKEGPKIFFRSAAEMLTRMGTWGGSLNLALLLRKRAEM